MLMRPPQREEQKFCGPKHSRKEFFFPPQSGLFAGESRGGRRGGAASQLGGEISFLSFPKRRVLGPFSSFAEALLSSAHIVMVSLGTSTTTSGRITAGGR